MKSKHQRECRPLFLFSWGFGKTAITRSHVPAKICSLKNINHPPSTHQVGTRHGSPTLGGFCTDSTKALRMWPSSGVRQAHLPAAVQQLHSLEPGRRHHVSGSAVPPGGHCPSLTIQPAQKLCPRVGDNPLLPYSGGLPMRASPLLQTDQVSSFLVQVAVTQARFLIHQH